jgi:hypothetical protein
MIRLILTRYHRRSLYRRLSRFTQPTIGVVACGWHSLHIDPRD